MATYSKNKNVVFYHIPKCAGLYVDSLLNNEDDFVTYNFITKSRIRFYWDYKTGIRQEFIDKCNRFMIGQDEMKKTFEFTFVRNPYTRFISAFFYCKSCNFEWKSPGSMDSCDSLISVIDSVSFVTYFHVFKTQWDNVKYDGEKELDYIGKFETMHFDIKEIFKKLGISLNYSKTKVNENKIDYGDYRNHITQKTLDFINHHFHDDFDKFGYTKIDKIEDLPPK